MGLTHLGIVLSNGGSRALYGIIRALRTEVLMDPKVIIGCLNNDGTIVSSHGQTRLKPVDSELGTHN